MGDKTKGFPFFSEDSYFTDDTVMTITVAEAFMDAPEDLRLECTSRLAKDLVDVLACFDATVSA